MTVSRGYSIYKKFIFNFTPLLSIDMAAWMGEHLYHFLVALRCKVTLISTISYIRPHPWSIHNSGFWIVLIEKHVSLSLSRSLQFPHQTVIFADDLKKYYIYISYVRAAKQHKLWKGNAAHYTVNHLRYKGMVY